MPRRQRGVRAIEKLLRTQARAKALYGKADRILEDIRRLIEVGDPIPLGDGRVARLVDQFADRTVCWKSASFSRYKVEVG